MRIATGRLTWPLLFAFLYLPCAAQQSAQPAKSPKERVTEARENLRAAEVAHPGNTVEVAEALDHLVSRVLDVEDGSPELLDLAKRELAVAEAAAGSRSKYYVNALVSNSAVYVRLGRPAEGYPFAEHAFEIAQQEFPITPMFIDAAHYLSSNCKELGDLACALRAGEAAISAERKSGPEHEHDLAASLSNVSYVKDLMGDHAGAGVDIEEAVSIYLHSFPNDPSFAIVENSAGLHYLGTQEFPKAIVHLNHALELVQRDYGTDSWMINTILYNQAEIYSRSGEFPLAWKNYAIVLQNENEGYDSLALGHLAYARSLASGGNLPRAIEEGLLAAQKGRENFVLQARTLPERQALAYNDQRPKGLDIVLSVLARHPELPTADIYQEAVRSRALVADEMARRQKNLNGNNDPEVARLLNEMDHARADLLAVEQKGPANQDSGDSVVQATNRMEKIERELAERSVDQRNDQRLTAVRLEDVRLSLPPHSVLISYVAYKRQAVEKVDPARTMTPAYVAFVLKPDSNRIRVYDLGDAKPIDDLVTRARASADAEARSGGLGSIRNERQWREAAEALRQRVWDPLRAEVGDAKLALVVPDGVLNLIPFSGLPEGKGYLVEHGPVIHILSSERDLVPAEGARQNAGLLAVGNPAFEQAGNILPASLLRDADITCEKTENVEFHPLPGTAAEVNDIHSAWQRWNSGESSVLETGAEATRARFLADAPQSRVLHIATHAFLLDNKCGGGNPLLRSGLIFAGVSHVGGASILTAQRIASMDLSGLDWAVLSACNTGNGELHDGEGVLGLERAFHEAGARSVVMSLWPVDDDLTRRFMHELYAQRLGLHATTADAMWNAERKLLLARRADGKSTHPWYWAGFVASGAWE
jgi:CHAT domain-containing protein/tetratricopeptide (TPR) repeat protein